MRWGRALAAGMALAAIAGGAPAFAWDRIVAGAAREAPECVSWAAGRIDCLMRMSTGALVWIYRENGRWSAPADLGGDLVVPVSCVVRGPGGINCFAPTGKGVLAEIHLNGANWSRWSSLGGDLAPRPASCVAPDTDRIACFARGRHGNLMLREWRGGRTWEAWRDMGGTFGGDPSCAVIAAGQIACFGRAPNGEFVGLLPSASGYSWVTYGGRVLGRPSCKPVGGVEVACAVRGEDDRLYVMRGGATSGRASGALTATGDPATDDPSCLVSGGEFVCFTRDAKRNLVRRSVSAAGTMYDGALLTKSPASTGLTCLEDAPGTIACIVADTERRVHYGTGDALGGLRLATRTVGDVSADSDEHEVAGVDDSAIGHWFLSSLESGSTCRVRLLDEAVARWHRLDLDSECLMMPGLGRAAVWQQDEESLSILSRRGAVLVRFRLTGSGRWISPGPDNAFLLSREAPMDSSGTPEPDAHATGAALEPTDMRGVVGNWRLTARNNGQTCGLRLTDWPAGSGHAAVLSGACSPELRAVQYWSFDGDTIVLTADGGDAVARFKRQNPSAWNGQDRLGGWVYTMTR